MTEHEQINTVDTMLPIPKLFAFGLQHVLAMYAGAVAVPIIVAQAMNLPMEDLIRLITADLFTCGIATLIQTLGFGNVGGRIPMIQGVTFASVGPMAMIGAQHGMPAIYGAIILAGLFTFLVAPFFSRFIRLFPPVVTGTIITLIGINLMPVAINWMGGGAGSPDFGSYTNIGLGFITFLIVVFVYKFATGFLGNLSVLIGLIAGTAIAFAMGVASFEEVGRSQWVAFIEPFYFGLPTFDWASVISMIVVMLVVMVETTGDSIAIGEIVDKKIGRKELASIIRADGVSTVIGGVLNSFPYTAFAQNVGLIAVTGVKSRFVVATSGIILILLGMFPKLAAVVASIPNAVLGGAGIAMFGMIIASGIRSLGKVSFDGNHNLMLVAISIGVAMIPIAAPTFYMNFPAWAQIILQSGITFGSITAILLNLLLNGVNHGDEFQTMGRR
ncbi:nucleobase:cation symporter-2 family protein [Veillonella rodentium]|uniref:Putative purine permease ygfU n=1 Tax=Veillonella rodentium TaxID=248315 RepID=A0A239ZIC7_9FIRM|nr:nucleobase:cation symporter-2 family protein [Veillonella rodentium]SNV70468.1 Putative purine permease ygfU [Veillonella rodentium]